ncbi:MULTISPECIES: hypothetical protein [unclassified Paenibacillus]|uniref:hypothetical protein n=1 Tax=unclassified Paenibacillus TaxID=185978 RepID=UPI001044E73F|nr:MULTISPECIES: hypothetical protein [unclassified Paenibacillus]NIK70766.1 phage-related holin [Paenibacillus sp. BK720]TCM93262.1 hypothetical protein EV294_107214 [Paenibacillus sp. BK033]
MDLGFIVFAIVLVIGTGIVKWKNMKDGSSKAMFFAVVGIIAVLIVFCVNQKIYSIMNITFMRAMVMGIYVLMRGQGV